MPDVTLGIVGPNSARLLVLARHPVTTVTGPMHVFADPVRTELKYEQVTLSRWICCHRCGRDAFASVTGIGATERNACASTGSSGFATGGGSRTSCGSARAGFFRCDGN